MAKRKKTDIVPLMLRLREELRGRLESAAKNQERSLNSEIVARLEESFRRSELASLTENVRALSSFREWVFERFEPMLEEMVSERYLELFNKAEEEDARGRTDSAERLRRIAKELLQPRSVPDQESGRSPQEMAERLERMKAELRNSPNLWARQMGRSDQEPELPMPHESAHSRLIKEGKS
jgi:16S rRNA C967 or C1407 C5-methylase (RsmB/RsmF family)